MIDLEKQVVSSFIGDGKDEIREGTAETCSIGAPVLVAVSPVTGTVLIISWAPNRKLYVLSYAKDTGIANAPHFLLLIFFVVGRVSLVPNLDIRILHCSNQGVFYAFDSNQYIVRIVRNSHVVGF